MIVSCHSVPEGRRRDAGFTLTELAVVLLIVGLLLSSLMYTLSAQSEARNIGETQRRLEDARELLIGFAIANGRLPCPASATSNGDESPSGGGPCTNHLNGFLPAIAIGFKPVDSSGHAIDAWGNRLRYAVAQHATNPPTGTSCSSPVTPAFTNPANLKANGIGCVPLNMVACDATQNTSDPAPGVNPPTCGTWGASGDARPVTNQRTVVALVFSTGKNAAIGSGGADEAENLDGDGVFVWHEPRPSSAAGGEYDDHMVWIPVGLLFNRMIAGGLLP
jgi:prepilin-type N-terminal cleavage/methylation domain-containing protein